MRARLAPTTTAWIRSEHLPSLASAHDAVLIMRWQMNLPPTQNLTEPLRCKGFRARDELYSELLTLRTVGIAGSLREREAHALTCEGLFIKAG